MKYLLIINSGSSSLKIKIFDSKLNQIFNGIIERIGLTQSFFIYQLNKKSYRINYATGIKDHHKALKEIIKILPRNIYHNIKLAGHRIVHGGYVFLEPTLLSPKVLNQISQFNKLAPIHNPINIKTCSAAMSELPRLKHYGVFDTQFHKDLPVQSYLYGLPIKYYRKDHLRKYGFHGLAHEYMYQSAVNKFGKSNLNLITCQLGNGASITAIKNGKVIDTSMGLTPLSGAVMGSRSGDLDPFIPLYLVKEGKMTPEAVYQLLNFQSGLKGICGYSDFREILHLAGRRVPGFKLTVKITKAKKVLAQLALKLYLYNIQKYVACYAGLLGKVDAVVFSGGVAEHRPDLREEIVRGVSFVSRPKVLVVKANEELMIARKIVKFLEKC